jgi:hypothetical protein
MGKEPVTAAQQKAKGWSRRQNQHYQVCVCVCVCVCVWVWVWGGGGRELASYAGSRSENLFEPLLSVKKRINKQAIWHTELCARAYSI